MRGNPRERYRSEPTNAPVPRFFWKPAYPVVVADSSFESDIAFDRGEISDVTRDTNVMRHVVPSIRCALSHSKIGRFFFSSIKRSRNHFKNGGKLCET